MKRALGPSSFFSLFFIFFHHGFHSGFHSVFHNGFHSVFHEESICFSTMAGTPFARRNTFDVHQTHAHYTKGPGEALPSRPGQLTKRPTALLDRLKSCRACPGNGALCAVKPTQKLGEQNSVRLFFHWFYHCNVGRGGHATAAAATAAAAAAAATAATAAAAGSNQQVAGSRQQATASSQQASGRWWQRQQLQDFSRMNMCKQRGELDLAIFLWYVFFFHPTFLLPWQA